MVMTYEAVQTWLFRQRLGKEREVKLFQIAWKRIIQKLFLPGARGCRSRESLSRLKPAATSMTETASVLLPGILLLDFLKITFSEARMQMRANPLFIEGSEGS